jgi:hypothetical protein
VRRSVDVDSTAVYTDTDSVRLVNFSRGRPQRGEGGSFLEFAGGCRERGSQRCDDRHECVGSVFACLHCPLHRHGYRDKGRVGVMAEYPQDDGKALHRREKSTEALLWAWTPRGCNGRRVTGFDL